MAFKSLFDPTFKYRDALSTDVRKTIRRIKRQQQLDQQSAQAEQQDVRSKVVATIGAGRGVRAQRAKDSTSSATLLPEKVQSPQQRSIPKVTLSQWRYTDEFGKRRKTSYLLTAEEAHAKLRDPVKVENSLEIRRTIRSLGDFARPMMKKP